MKSRTRKILTGLQKILASAPVPASAGPWALGLTFVASILGHILLVSK